MAGYAAEILDFEDVEQGTTFEWGIILLGYDSNPLDLSGLTIRAMLRKRYSDASPTLVFTVAPVNILAGEVVISATAAQMAAIPKGRYVYDVEVEDASGKVYKPYKGTMIITPEATK